MAWLWLIVPLALVAALGYAGWADHVARRDGEVIVPVKNGFGRRTTFVRMSRADRDQQRAEMIVARQQKERADRRAETGIPTPGRALGGALRKLLAPNSTGR